MKPHFYHFDMVIKSRSGSPGHIRHERDTAAGLIIVTNNTTKRGPTSLLQRQIEQVSQLPRAKQKFVSDMLDTVIQQAGS